MRRLLFTAFLTATVIIAVACASSSGSPSPSEAGTPDPENSVGTDGLPLTTQTPSPVDNSQTFSLLSTNGGVVNFSDLRGNVPVAVFFYGGGDCPVCEEWLMDLQINYGRFKEIGAEVIAISTNPPEQTRATADSKDLQFPVLSDSDGAVSEKWGVVNPFGNGHAIPSMFVFAGSGDEIARKVGASAEELPAVEETLQVIQRSLEAGTAEPTSTPVSLGQGVTDFQLPDAINGGEVSLSKTLTEKNVVLVFYRAFW